MAGFNESFQTVTVPEQSAPTLLESLPKPGADAAPFVGTQPMPESHGNVDVQAMSPGDVIKACSYLSKVALTNPKLAESHAENAIQVKKQEAEMRQQGASEQAIKKQSWAAASQRHKQKIKAEEKPLAEKVIPDATLQSTPKPAHRSVAGQEMPKPSAPEATKSELFPLGLAMAAEQTVAKVASLSKENPLVVAGPKPIVTPALESFTLPVAVAAATERLAAKPQLPEAHTETVAVGLDLPESKVRHAIMPEARVLVADDPVIPIEAFTTPPTYSEPTGEATDTAPFDYLPAEQAATSETIKHTELVLPAVVDTLEYSEPDARLAIDESEALSVTDQLVAEEDITKIIERAAEPTELAPTESASVQWTEVLIEEPSKIYQDFTEALHQVITAPPEEQPVTGEDNTIPPIVVIVAQRIAELEPAETEAVMPAVQNIVAALATLRSLQETALTPKAAEAQCELLVIELLETLAVKYAPEDAQQFTRLITRPDFTPLLQGHHTAKPTDLLHQGTHEAKQLLLQLDNGLAGLEYELRYMLGSFALFCSSDLPVNAYELAA